MDERSRKYSSEREKFMDDFIFKLFESKIFYTKELTVGVLPESNVLHLAGYIEFGGKSPSHGHDERFAGHESAQLKKSLREIADNDKTIAILVNLNPCAKPGKETLYHFQITQHFADSEAMNKDINDMKTRGIISRHTYDVKAPKREKTL